MHKDYFAQSSSKKEKFMNSIRAKQRSQIINRTRALNIYKFQQEMYWRQYDKIFYEEHQQEIEEEQLRKKYQEQEQQFYNQMYRQYIKESELQQESCSMQIQQQSNNQRQEAKASSYLVEIFESSKQQSKQCQTK